MCTGHGVIQQFSLIDLDSILSIFQANFWVLAANLGFSFLAVFHLAYLGIMFGSDSGEQERVKKNIPYRK